MSIQFLRSLAKIPAKVWACGLMLPLCLGCANLARPSWFNPGTVEQQRLRALHSDPYPDTDAGPEVVGARPREFNQSLPEAVKNQPYSFLDPYGNPTF